MSNHETETLERVAPGRRRLARVVPVAREIATDSDLRTALQGIMPAGWEETTASVEWSDGSITPAFGLVRIPTPPGEGPPVDEPEATEPDKPITARDAWLIARAISGVDGEGEVESDNPTVAALLGNLSSAPLADRLDVFRAWLDGREDAGEVKRLVADANPTGPAPDAEDEAAEPGAGEEVEDGDFDPFSPDAVRLARQSIDLTKIGDFHHGVATLTLRRLAGDSDQIYQRDGVLVRLVRKPKDGSTAAEIRRYSEIALQDEISRVVHFYVKGKEDVEVEVDGEKKTKKQEVKRTKPCPRYLPKMLVDRGEYPGIRPLDRIVTAPVFRADGSVVSSPGYDADAWIFYEPDAEYPVIPVAPTRADAQAALKEIMDLVAEFPWVGERDRMVWLAGLLTLVGRDLFDGPSPLFALDGNQRGVGKGLLTDVVSLIATGRKAPPGVSMRGRDGDDELRKVIDSMVLAGSSGMMLLDNLTGPIGGAILDSAITSSRRAGRKLGGNETFDAEARIVYWANGNNLSTTGDSSRRALIAKLSYTASDRAAEGRDFKIPDLAGYVEANRPRLYVAAMTILRAYIVAGKPAPVKPLGSFERWSWTIASTVNWLTGINPIDAVAYHVIDDPVDEINGAILAGFYGMLRQKGELKTGVKSAAIIARVKPGISGRSDYPDLADALSEIAPGGKDLPTTRSLSQRLRTIVDRPIGGLILRKLREDRDGVTLWTVERVGQEAEPGEGAVDTIPFRSSTTSSPTPRPAAGGEGAAK